MIFMVEKMEILLYSNLSLMASIAKTISDVCAT